MYSAHVNDDSDDQCDQKEQNVLLAHDCDDHFHPDENCVLDK